MATNIVARGAKLLNRLAYYQIANLYY